MAEWLKQAFLQLDWRFKPIAMGEGGAVGKGKEDDLENAYELLELEEDAGEKEIKATGPVLAMIYVFPFISSSCGMTSISIRV